MPILTWRFGANTIHVFTRRSIELLRLAAASGIFLFRDTLLPRVLEDCGPEGGAPLGVGFARS